MWPSQAKPNPICKVYFEVGTSTCLHIDMKSNVCLSMAHRTLPLFVWHRQNWNIVFPHVELTERELANLTSHGSYVAGFTDATIEARTELYDLFVNGKLVNLVKMFCFDNLFIH